MFSGVNLARAGATIYATEKGENNYLEWDESSN